MLASSAPLTAETNLGLAPGTIIGGKYRIDGCLGTGGMGVVLSATHLDLDAPVAIKVVRAEFAQNEEVVSRLLFEARAAARMRGVHIVRVLDVARLETGAPYIVMEQLQGADLGMLLAERGALSIRDAIDYVLQACEGLAEAHRLGIIHRDLKPENLFLAETPEGTLLKILDFGISKNVGTTMPRTSRSSLTRTGSAVGSPYYMSPEQMRASPDLDARADIWSLGAILFELLTGHCPFEGETPALLCAKVMVDEAPSLREFSNAVPEPLDVIVRHCLEKDPGRRFQTVRELADALRSFTAALPSDGGSPRLASGIDLKTQPEPDEGGEAAERQRGTAGASSARGTTAALVLVVALLLVAGAAFWRLQHPSAAASFTVNAATELDSPRRSRPTPREDALAPAVANEAPSRLGAAPDAYAPRINRAAPPAPRSNVPTWSAPQRAPLPSSPWPTPAPPPDTLPPPEIPPPPSLAAPTVAPTAAPAPAERVVPAAPVDPNSPAVRYGL